MSKKRILIVSIGIAVLGSIICLGNRLYDLLIRPKAMPPVLETQNRPHPVIGFAGDAPGGFGGNPPPLPPTPPIPPGIMRVGTRLMGLKIVRRIEPVYPEIAMQTRLATNIALEATLDEAGDVKEVHILRGHPLLNEAALNAVERWKFGQTLLNGTPVRVITTIILPFKNHGKLDPEIAALMFRFQKDAQHDPAKNEFVSGGMATVDLILTEWSPQNIRNLRDLGFLPSGQSQDVKSLTGRMPVEKLSSLLRLKAIDFIALHRNK